MIISKRSALDSIRTKLRLVFDSLKSPLPPYQINRVEDRIVVSIGNVPQIPGPQIAVQEKRAQGEGAHKGKEVSAEPAPAPVENSVLHRRRCPSRQARDINRD